MDVRSERRFTVFVGDVHGCLGELVRLLQQIGLSPDLVRLVFLGDLVDRGPDPVGVLRFVRMLTVSGMQVHTLLGNHEDKHLLYRSRQERFFREGTPNQVQFKDQYKLDHAEMAPEDFEFMAGLPAYLRFGIGGLPWLATHAGVPTDVPIEQQKISKLIRTRYVKRDSGKYASPPPDHVFDCPPDAMLWYERWAGPEHVIYGHMVQNLSDPVVFEREGVRSYGIDTGCVFGGRLTALVLDGEREGGSPRFIQVQARQAYAQLQHTVE